MCACLCPTYWTTFGIAERNRNGSCPMHEWDHPHVIFVSFCPHGGRLPPKGEKTPPDPGYARMQNMAWIGPRVAEKSLTEQTNKHTVKQIPRPSLYERMAGKKHWQNITWSPAYAERAPIKTVVYTRVNGALHIENCKKIQKGDYPPAHRLSVNVLLSNSTFL